MCVSTQLFPALVYRPEPTGTVFLVFESGRVVITGSRSVAGAEAAQRAIDKVLVQCYCKRGPAYSSAGPGAAPGACPGPTT